MKNKTNPWICAVMILLLGMVSVMAGDYDDKIEKTFNVKAGGLLNVKADLGSIDVDAVPGNKVNVQILFKSKRGSQGKFKEAIEELDINIEKVGNDVMVSVENDHSWDFWDNISRYLQIKFVIQVPTKFDVDLKTAGGSIKVDDLEGKAHARTSGGSLRFGHIEGTVNGKTSGGSIDLSGCIGNADVKTSGGSIHIGKVQGTVSAHTSGGRISVEEVMGTIDAGTSGGSINATITRQPKDDCRLTTSGGSIMVHLSKDIQVNVNAGTSGGHVKTDFPVMVKGEISKRKLTGEINGGGPELYLRTSGGSIQISEI